jgi:lipid-binding SYLF domain-containing protein
MRKLLLSLLALSLLLSGGLALADAAEEAKADQATMKKFMDSDVVQKFAKNAYGYAVFPTIGKGGVIIGGGHGKGRVYVGGKRVGTTSMTQLSIGFQLGGEAYSELIFFQDKRAYEEFTSGEFEFGAQAQAIAITSSAGAGASTTGSTASANTAQAKTSYHNGMAVFIVGKGGLMYEASVGGQKFNFKAD